MTTQIYVEGRIRTFDLLVHEPIIEHRYEKKKIIGHIHRCYCGCSEMLVVLAQIQIQTLCNTRHWPEKYCTFTVTTWQRENLYPLVVVFVFSSQWRGDVYKWKKWALLTYQSLSLSPINACLLSCCRPINACLLSCCRPIFSPNDNTQTVESKSSTLTFRENGSRE
jgi:hypothetical protein